MTRDLDILGATPGVSVGFSILTDNDEVRKVLEPHAPPIGARLSALRKLHEAGIATWVFIAPILPMNPNKLYEAIAPDITYLTVDPLDYRNQVKDIFLKQHWEYEHSDHYAAEPRAILMGRREKRGRRAEVGNTYREK